MDRAGRQQRAGAEAGQVGRHRARRNAMMVLYRLDVVGGGVGEAIDEFRSEHGFDLPDYAASLVRGVHEQIRHLDDEIGRRLKEGWSVGRLGAVERSILRIALFEMGTRAVPDEVAVDEAVELAKRYASPEAAKLVNGVLGAAIRERGDK